MKKDVHENICRQNELDETNNWNTKRAERDDLVTEDKWDGDEVEWIWGR